MLNKFWTALGSRRGVNRDVQWFQQDGATPHTANITMEWLDHRFPDRLISRRREPEWSPHSPDLNPPDVYLWGFLNDHVYENRPQSIAELKVAITQKIRAIRKEECYQGDWQLCSSASSVPAAQRWSFGTCALIKLSFKLETSNLQFFIVIVSASRKCNHFWSYWSE